MAAHDKFDHIGFTVSDIARSKAFYERALAPLGIGLVMEVTTEMTGGHAHAGYGHDGKPYFWIGEEYFNVNSVEGTDYHAVANGYVSVTPLRSGKRKCRA